MEEKKVNENLITKAITNSSQISQFVYDTKKEELTVTFKNNSKYKYVKVPLSTWTSLNALPVTESVGKWFNNNIRNKFDYSKL